jgi:hypothetical protein
VLFPIVHSEKTDKINEAHLHKRNYVYSIRTSMYVSVRIDYHICILKTDSHYKFEIHSFDLFHFVELMIHSDSSD